MTSIIIINFKTPLLVLKCIESVKKCETNNDYEFIVVDNNSNDGSFDFLKQLDCKIIKNNANLGFGSAINQAVKISDGDFIWLLNSDCIVKSSPLDEYINFIKNNENVGCVGSIMLNADNMEQHSYGSFHKVVKRYNKIKSISLKNVRYDLQNGKASQVEVVVGANLFMEKKIFNMVGGFDSKIFLYEEELEMQLRLFMLGYKSYMLPIKVIQHSEGVSSNILFRRKCILISSCYIIKKHTNQLNYIYYRLKMILFAFFFFKNPKVSFNDKFSYLLTAINLSL